MYHLPEHKKHVWLLLFLLPSLFLNAQFKYLKYPDYNIVVAHFFENYSVAEIGEQSKIQFEKKPDGWHVAVLTLASPTVIKRNELLWSYKKNKFLNLTFPAARDSNENKVEEDKFLATWQKYYYRTVPYYGYDACCEDVIKGYKNVQGLPDSILYSLGQAYQWQASSLIGWDNGFVTGKNFNLPPGKNSMSASQLATFRSYNYHAIETYKRVYLINPSFETIVGNIKTKIANTYVGLFVDLRMYQNEQEAIKELPDNIYDEFEVASAQNYLTTCAKNAILFTYGDNDTYPLLYIQAKTGYRKDVLVVNLSLLQSDRYINSLREKILDAAPLPVSFSPEQIAGKKRELVIIQRNEQLVADLFKLLQFVKNDSNTLDYGGGNHYFYFPSDSIALPIDGGTGMMRWKIEDAYLSRAQLIMLDVLANNNWNRPIYISIASSSDMYLGLSYYFRREGLAYRIDTIRMADADGYWGKVNAPVIFDNFFHRFNWNGLNSLLPHEKLSCLNYVASFCRLAEAFIADGRPDSAGLVLDKCVELFPDKILPYDIFHISLAGDYYKIKDFKKGNEVAKTIAANALDPKPGYQESTLSIGNAGKQETLSTLKELVKKYGQQEILQLPEQR